MVTRIKWAALALLLMLPSCDVLNPFSAEPARVTTAEERAGGKKTLTRIEGVLTLALAAKKIKQEDWQLAMTQLTELRGMLDNSEVVPIDWTDFESKLLKFAGEWLIEGEDEE